MSQGFHGNLNPYAPPEQRFDQGFGDQGSAMNSGDRIAGTKVVLVGGDHG
jgi:hypothetical protein